MTTAGASLDDVLSESARPDGVAIYFADGSAVVRGGYRTVGSALDGPLGVQHSFAGRPSPGLQLEIELRGRPQLAVIGSALGSSLVIDGTSLWLATLAWDPVPSLAALQDARTAAQLVRGPGLADPRAPDGGLVAGPSRPPPPVRPQRPGRPARPEVSTARTVAAVPTGGNVPDWLERIMSSNLIRSRAGRRRVSDSDIRRILRVLDNHGSGGVLFSALAEEAGVSERRVPGYLAQLSEIVNIDGYEVITVSAQSARFDRALLERQLQITR